MSSININFAQKAALNSNNAVKKSIEALAKRNAIESKLDIFEREAVNGNPNITKFVNPDKVRAGIEKMISKLK